MLRGIERETLYTFILLLVLLPQPTITLDCQMACDSCYDENEDPPLREVYCSMCEECLEAKDMKTEKPVNMERLPRLQNPNKPENQPLRMQEYGWEPQEQGQGMYPECPTAAPCPEEEEEEEEIVSRDLVVSEPNCPNPYMAPCLPLCPPLCPPTTPRPTCPPIIPCKPKKLKAKKKTKPPMTPSCCWPFPYAPQATPGQEKLKDTTIKDFVYVYVGVPKGVIANDKS